MTYRKPYAALLIFALSAFDASAQPEADVATLLTKALPDIPGKEAVMLTVEYPPGGTSAAHRHGAHVFVYVIEGSVVMQVKGGDEVTLTAGQTFYETPADVHTVSRNASMTQPAKFLALLVKDTGVPPVLPAE